MRCNVHCFAAALIVLGANLNAATFNFVTDPFAGSDALTTPGIQIVGGEPSISFSPALLSAVFSDAYELNVSRSCGFFSPYLSNSEATSETKSFTL